MIKTSDRVVIRETTCKTILNKWAAGGYSLNCYTGCEHACVYCYARYMQRFHPHPEPWGKFVDVKVNAVEVLTRQLCRVKPGSVFMSSACDCWQPVEAERELTRRCCELLLKCGFQVNILSKSALVLRDLDILAGRNATVGITITTLDENMRKLWEPEGASVKNRLRVVEEVSRAKLKTSLMFGPLLPFLSDSQESVDAMFQTAADLKIDTIWVDGLNRRPKVWNSIAPFLRKNFPHLLQHYSGILFNSEIREPYLDQLRKRVFRVAERFSLTDRLAGCA